MIFESAARRCRRVHETIEAAPAESTSRLAPVESALKCHDGKAHQLVNLAPFAPADFEAETVESDLEMRRWTKTW